MESSGRAGGGPAKCGVFTVLLALAAAFILLYSDFSDLIGDDDKQTENDDILSEIFNAFDEARMDPPGSSSNKAIQPDSTASEKSQSEISIHDQDEPLLTTTFVNSVNSSGIPKNQQSSVSGNEEEFEVLAGVKAGDSHESFNEEIELVQTEKAHQSGSANEFSQSTEGVNKGQIYVSEDNNSHYQGFVTAEPLSSRLVSNEDSNSSGSLINRQMEKTSITNQHSNSSELINANNHTVSVKTVQRNSSEELFKGLRSTNSSDPPTTSGIEKNHGNESRSEGKSEKNKLGKLHPSDPRWNLRESGMDDTDGGGKKQRAARRGQTNREELMTARRDG